MSCAAVLLVRLPPPLPVLHPGKRGGYNWVAACNNGASPLHWWWGVEGVRWGGCQSVSMRCASFRELRFEQASSHSPLFSPLSRQRRSPRQALPASGCDARTGVDTSSHAAAGATFKGDEGRRR